MMLSLAGLLQPDQIDRALCLWYGPPEMAIRNDNKSLLLQLHCLVLHSAGTPELSQWENNNNKKKPKPRKPRVVKLLVGKMNLTKEFLIPLFTSHQFGRSEIITAGMDTVISEVI